MKVKYFDLKGKRALVSGGASGIGSSIVEHLCEQGVEVYFFDIDKKEAQKTIHKIKKKKLIIPTFIECNIKKIQKYKTSIYYFSINITFFSNNIPRTIVFLFSVLNNSMSIIFSTKDFGCFCKCISHS